MLTLKQVIEETGISRPTLTKYRGLGLVPKPKIVYHGYKQGKESLYPDDTTYRIGEVQRLRDEGYSLSQIRDELSQMGHVEDITPTHEVSEPIESDDMLVITKAARRIAPRLDKLLPDHERVKTAYEFDEVSGKLRVTKVWGVKKADKHKTTNSRQQPENQSEGAKRCRR